MPAQWTAELVGKLHLYGITQKELAAEAGLHDKYLSVVLNGHRNPPAAETKLNAALNRLIEKRRKS